MDTRNYSTKAISTGHITRTGKTERSYGTADLGAADNAGQ